MLEEKINKKSFFSNIKFTSLIVAIIQFIRTLYRICMYIVQFQIQFQKFIFMMSLMVYINESSVYEKCARYAQGNVQDMCMIKKEYKLL